ncbi:MAG TPA: cation diffusion facilitator family transporter [Gammaproteobacteria bacterium]|nr:cation diffusion facilitator family transporter [Gammaproteobacteria bacterium]
MHDHATSHSHPHRGNQRHYWLALAVTLGFAAVEAFSGWRAHSLALLGDAGHMATDGIALGIAGVAALVARKPASERHSYGLGRVEVIAATFNTLFMLLIVALIFIEALARLRHRTEVHAQLVMLIGALGLAANFLIYKILEGGERNLNLRASLLHVLGDVLGSVAALAAGAIIYLTGWLPADPLLSLFIGLLILLSSLKLLSDATHVLLEGVPRDMDLPGIGRSMAAVQGVGSVHDLHVWSVSSGEVSLSAHVVIEEMGLWEAVYSGLRSHLHDAYGIDHITLQPEPRVKARISVGSIRRR